MTPKSAADGIVQSGVVGRFLQAARSTIRTVLPMVIEAHQAPSRAASCKNDGTLVTETDHEVERIFIAALRAALPQVSIVAEESEAERTNEFAGSIEEFYAPLTKRSPLVIVDPIDGTKNFVEGRDEFCVAVALVGQVPGGVWPIAGIVAIPVEDKMFWSDGESVFEETISSTQAKKLIRNESKAEEVSVSSTDRRWIEERSMRLLNPWVSSGSSVYDMTGTVTGRLKGSIVGTQRLWDLMAPLALADVLGLELRDLLSGERLTSITREDLSSEIEKRPWGLARKVVILPAGRIVSEIVSGQLARG